MAGPDELGTLGLLADTPLDGRQRELVLLARQSGETPLGIINDILDFSKIEANMLAIEPAPFDLGQTAREERHERRPPQDPAGG
jgi:signal transduction histidine kinase